MNGLSPPPRLEERDTRPSSFRSGRENSDDASSDLWTRSPRTSPGRCAVLAHQPGEAFGKEHGSREAENAHQRHGSPHGDCPACPHRQSPQTNQKAPAKFFGVVQAGGMTTQRFGTSEDGMPEKVREVIRSRGHQVLAWSMTNTEKKLGLFMFCSASWPLPAVPCFWPHLLILGPFFYGMSDYATREASAKCIVLTATSLEYVPYPFVPGLEAPLDRLDHCSSLIAQSHHPASHWVRHVQWPAD
jgi:hypothetical protein